MHEDMPFLINDHAEQQATQDACPIQAGSQTDAAYQLMQAVHVY